MAVDANSNSSRLWSLSKPIKTVANYLNTKATGFYSINGHNVLEFPENNKKENFVLFLEKVREINPFGRFVIILDNFRTHHAIIVREKAEDLNIYFCICHLIFLTSIPSNLYGKALKEFRVLDLLRFSENFYSFILTSDYVSTLRS